MQQVRNKRVVVAGLGRFGGNVAAARWLARHGARVLVTDAASPQSLAESVQQLHGLPIEYRLGEHRESDFASADLVVASPAIPPHNPYLLAARCAGVAVTTEIRLLIERCPATIIGITGTKGKSTTTAMLGDMLRRRFTTWIGGNIGKSLLPDLGRIDKTHLVVLELSSFMLDYLEPMRWSPHVAVVTFIAADHLSWHGGEEAYLDAKRNLVRFQRPDDLAVVCETSPPALEFAEHTAARVIRYGVADRPAFDLALPGQHNQLNAQGAFAAAAALGVTWDEARAALASFQPLPHRLELVHEADGVRWYNDSIATIPEAAVAALDAFPPRTVIQIVGGSDKGLPLTAMCNALCDRAKAALCIGATGPAIAERMAQFTSPARAPTYQCGDLPTAVQLARTLAAAGDVVLLSPGCASFDQFIHFEQRGLAFRQLAQDSTPSAQRPAPPSPWRDFSR